MEITSAQNRQWLDWMDNVRSRIIPVYESTKQVSPYDVIDAFPLLHSTKERKIADMLLDFSYKGGKNVTSAMSDFVLWLTEIFDYSHVFNADFEEYTKAECEKNPIYAELAARWIRDVRHTMTHGGIMSSSDIGCALDWFGKTYEENFQGKGKADALGQFYTPGSVCRLIAELSKDSIQGDTVFSDCCCGSGRLLLSATNIMDKHHFNYFIGEDIDIESVRMCALNLMIHGLRGVVICHDSLTHENFSAAYEVNESISPFFTGYYSIRKITEDEAAAHFDRRYNNILIKERMVKRAIEEYEGNIEKAEPFAVHYDECRSQVILSNPPFGTKISEASRQKFAKRLEDAMISSQEDFFVVLDKAETDKREENIAVTTDDNGQMNIDFDNL